MHLFAYGTLMFPDVWQRVVGREFSTAPAALTGYAVYRVRNGVYPALVEAPAGSRVTGLIYRDVDDASWALLDEYESDLYDRIAVAPMTAGGDYVACQAYVLPNAKRSLASDKPWDAARFERDELPDYLRRLGEE